MKKLITFITLLCVCSSYAYTQIAIRKLTSVPELPDSLDLAYYAPKKGFRTTSMVVGINMGVWAFDRYIRKADFAYINGRTIKENFRHGFVWDNDAMGTNMFMHPYHGSLYFNSARSNGYNYWQSGLFSIGGSAMWELAMENEYPSTNDIIATPIGGLAVGEVLYRASDLILCDNLTGWRRFGREAAAFIVSPMRGLTRILSGDAWRVRGTSGRQFGVPKVYVQLSLGTRVLELNDEILDKGVGFASELSLEYGDRFDAEKKKPYDYFSFKIQANVQSGQPVLGQLNIIGRLIGKEIRDDDKRYLSIGLYQHFDYYDSDTISDVSSKTPYKFSIPASVGAGLIYKYKRLKYWDVDMYAHLNGILLGGALSDYYKVDQRNYNLASGFSTKVGFNFIYKKDIFAISSTYDVYRMYTWKGYPDDIDWDEVDYRTLDAQGDQSKAILHAISVRGDVKLRNNFYLTMTNTIFSRKTNYKMYDDVTSTTFENRLMLTYKF